MKGNALCAQKAILGMNIGGPGVAWGRLMGRDCRVWGLSAVNPCGGCAWISGVRSATRAASQLSGRGPTDVDVAPVPAR